MNKITLCIVFFLAIQFNLKAQCPGVPPAGYTCIPDANFEQALIDFGYDTEGTLDGQMKTIDATNRPTLFIINKGVLDFTGIEAFVSITALDVSYNPGLETLNTSSNPLIQSLDTEGCIVLTGLNLTNNPALTSLNLYDNDLSTLDLSSNTSLETVDLRLNQLGSLDFSNHPSLTSINVKNNMLTFLDMRNGFNGNMTFFDSDFNTDLVCLYVDDSNAGYLTALPWIIDVDSTFANNEAACNTLSVEFVESTLFNVYPNPASDFIFITSSTSDALLELYDVFGKRIVSKSIFIGSNSFDISKLSSGMYITRLKTQSKTETIKLIIK